MITPGSGRASYLLGFVCYEIGNYARAQQLCAEGLALCRVDGHELAAQHCIYGLGLVARALGDYDQARRCHEENLAVCRAVGFRWGMVWALHNLGLIAYRQADYTAAEQLVRDGLAIARVDQLPLEHGLWPQHARDHRHCTGARCRGAGRRGRKPGALHRDRRYGGHRSLLGHAGRAGRRAGRRARRRILPRGAARNHRGRRALRALEILVGLAVLLIGQGKMHAGDRLADAGAGSPSRAPLAPGARRAAAGGAGRPDSSLSHCPAAAERPGR